MEELFPEVIDKLCRCMVFTFKGERLSSRDTQLMRTAFGAQSSLLRDLLPEAQAWREWCGFLGSGTLDVDVLAKTLKWCCNWLHCLCAHYSDNLDILPGAIRDVCDFKHHMREQKLLWGFVVPLRTVIDDILSSFTVRNFDILNQWFSFLTHITLRDVDLKTELIDEYVRLEEAESGWTFSLSDVAACHDIIHDWFKHFQIETLTPQHGPGATATIKRNSGRLEKYYDMCSDMRLEYFLRPLSDPHGTLIPPGFRRDGTLDRTSVLQCVPKSMNKNRTISMEPTTLQFYQHGFRTCVDSYLQGHPVLRGRIDLHDQLSSRHLAQLGSADGSYATIDLSSASDTITLKLIKLLFRGSPMLRPLICLRSDRTRLPSGKSVTLNKYAPMGSDLCFITMCVVLASACEASVRRTVGRTSRWNDYRVYGDDIVIRSEFVPALKEILMSFHFDINFAKSFCDVDLFNFREACGGEYVNEFDVTPLRVSRRLKSLHVEAPGTMPTVEVVSSYVSLANDAMRAGLLCVRRYVLYVLAQWFPKFGKLPYFWEEYSPECRRSGYEEQNPYTLPSTSTSILTYDWCCTNFRVKCRTSRYQRLEYRVVSSRSCEGSTPFTRANLSSIDDYRYYEHWLTLPHRAARYEAGIEIIPKPARGLLPSSQKWEEKWVSPYGDDCLLRGKQTP